MKDTTRRKFLASTLVASGAALLAINAPKIRQGLTPEPLRIKLIGDSIVWQPPPEIRKLYRVGVYTRDGYAFENSWTNMSSTKYFKNVIGTYKEFLDRFDAIIYNAGLHDAREIRSEETTLGEYRENLEYALNYLDEASDAKVIFRETTPVVPGEHLRNNELIADINAIAKDVSDENDIPYIPVWGIYQQALDDEDYSLWSLDKLHLSAKGQDLLFGKIVSELDKMELS